MSTGLIALLDDVTALAKVAAASIDDIALKAAKAGSKATGIVIDDAAVTPRYVVGFAADRELPVIRKIAAGSLRNKLLFLLPGALALSYFAPSAITPLLMAGGVYLCLEGFHKVYEIFHPHHGSGEAAVEKGSAQRVEDLRVAGAIRTDFVLSAEIMAIALATVADSPIPTQMFALVAVGIGITALVYGAVAVIVKADDAGMALALSSSPIARKAGRALVSGMPLFLNALSFVGMLAMLWVGGGIQLHGLAQLGVPGPEEAIHHAGETAAAAMPVAKSVTAWLVRSTASGVIGLAIGAAVAALLAIVRRAAVPAHPR